MWFAILWFSLFGIDSAWFVFLVAMGDKEFSDYADVLQENTSVVLFRLLTLIGSAISALYFFTH